jgi:hypothetical protein
LRTCIGHQSQEAAVEHVDLEGIADFVEPATARPSLSKLRWRSLNRSLIFVELEGIFGG